MEACKNLRNPSLTELYKVEKAGRLYNKQELREAQQ